MITLAGDFNQLPDASVIDKTGLAAIVQGPTRGSSFLDRIYTSDINYENIKIVKSSVRSDHFCIIAYSGETIKCYAKSKRLCEFRRRSPDQKATFLQNANVVDTDTLSSLMTLSLRLIISMHRCYYCLILSFPKTITLTDRDPAVKQMLREKNRLLKRNKIEQASALALRIGNSITKHNATSLAHCNHRFNSADMWSKVRQ